MKSQKPLTVVTGGSRGIGKAIALRLAADGHDVVVGFRSDASAANAVVQQILTSGRTAAAISVDITDPDSVAAFFAEASSIGSLTGVVANAGRVQAVGALVDLDPVELRRDLEVNLLGAVLTCQAAIPYLAATGGAMVTIGSAAVTSGSPGSYVHYAAAKAGVEALSRGLAKELAPLGIRVNCVEPGTVWSDFHRDPQRPATVAATIPLQRAGQPEEIAGAVAWLLSADASYTTGSTLRVAGGL